MSKVPFIEPFCGSAAVTYGLLRARRAAPYRDSNSNSNSATAHRREAMSQFVRTKARLYHLDPVPLPEVPEVAPSVSHHILVLDRSGSMYYTIEELKKQVEHVLAVNAATAGDVLTTLISFSSQGDVTTHWARVPARDVIAGGSGYVDALRRIRATALTCISQALMQGLGQVRQGETTGLTLFTDGYANHPSPSTENARFDVFVEQAKAFSGLFVNCVGYREWCDWPRMAAISKALHGKTVKAKSMLDVLAVMKDTQELLASGSMSMVKVQAAGKASDWLLAVDTKTGSVLTAAVGGLNLAELVIPAEDLTAWDVYLVSELPDGKARPPKGAYKADSWIFGALALAKLQDGDVNAAKGLVFSSGNKTIWEDYQAAFTASRLADFAAELTQWVKGKNTYTMGRNTEPKYSLFALAEVLNSAPSRSLALDTASFLSQYKRRSVKRVMGKRLPDGQLELPNSELDTGSSPVYIRAVEFNTSDASMQLGTIQAAVLKSKGKALGEVAHVSLHDLASFRSYTILSSGEFNVEELPLRVLNAKAWSLAKRFLTPSQAKRKFVPNMLVKINLRRFGLPASETGLNTHDYKLLLDELYGRLARQKILSALRVKEATSDYSPEQIAALREVHLTPALYYSPPTTTPYTDKDQAVARGEIDFYTRYKVYFGSTDIRNPSEFRSGNNFLQTYFTGELNGEVLKKPTFADHWQGATFKSKNKAPANAADRLMMLATESLLPRKDLTHEIIESAYAHESQEIEKLQEVLRTAVFEIGCRGMLPAGLDAEMVMYTPEKYADVFEVKLKKAETEATFYVAVNGLLVSVVPESCEYSTDLKAAAN